MHPNTDYYAVLGVDKTADAPTIKKAYRDLARKYHPDHHNGNKEYEEKLKLINEAYSVLSDPEKRSQYDRPAQGPGNFDFPFADLFNFGNFSFNFGNGPRRSPSPRPGSDIEQVISIALVDAIFGCKREVSVGRRLECPTCTGTGAAATVVCQACEGKGQVQSRPTPNQTIVHTCRACSGKGRVATARCEPCKGMGSSVEKSQLEVHIPAGIRHGQILAVKGRGESGSFGGPPGDLYLRVDVRYPVVENMSDEEKSELRTILEKGVVPVQG